MKEKLKKKSLIRIILKYLLLYILILTIGMPYFSEFVKLLILLSAIVLTVLEYQRKLEFKWFRGFRKPK